MRELIDKKRTEAKVFLTARFFIDRPDREVELVKAVIHRCCEEIDKQPTIEAEPVRHGRCVYDETMYDTITIEECIIRLDAIRHEIVPDSRDYFALSAGIAALYKMGKIAETGDDER